MKLWKKPESKYFKSLNFQLLQSLKLGWARHYSFICQGVDFSDAPEAVDYAWKVCYGYFVIKVADLLDTVSNYNYYYLLYLLDILIRVKR